MKKSVILISVFLLFTGFTGLNAKKRNIDKIKFPPLNKIEKPVIKKDITNNGIKLRLINNYKFPIITLRAYIKGGNVYDPSDKTGLASVTANLLRIGGAGAYSSEKIDNLLDSKGITLEIYSNEDYFTITLSSLKENFNESVKLLSQILQKPLFNKEKFEEIKTRLSSSISRRNDDPGSVASREFEKLVYGPNSPLTAQMEYVKLDNIKLSDVKDLYGKFFKPANILAGVTGPIDMTELKKIIEKYFGDWSGKTVIPDYPVSPENKNNFRVAFAQKDDLNQSYINIGQLGFLENIDKKADILVFNSIFSQGFNSRLMQRLRVKMGLTYGIGGGIIDSYFHPGKVYFSTFTKSESTLPVVKAVFEEIDRIRKEKVTETELNDAKNYFLNSYVFKFSSPEKILFEYMGKEFYGLDIEKYNNLTESIKKVTADDILKIAKTYMDPDKMVVMIVGNSKKIEGKLSELGKVRKIDISIKPPVFKEKIPPATKSNLEKGKKIVLRSLNKNYRGYKNIRSIKSTSIMELNMMGRNLSLENETYTKFPDKVYTLTKVMGMKMERVVNGTRGIIKQMGQKKIIPAADILKSRFGSVYNIFHDSGKYSFQYIKKEKIGGSEYDIIYITDSNGNWVKFFVNSKNGLIEIKEKIENIAGVKGVAKIVNSQFKKVKGIFFAFKSDIFINGKKKVGITLKDVKINPEISTEKFKID